MLSIVIPIYNQAEMTAECINAIREHTRDFELVIIDNGSDPPFKPPFTGHQETVLIRNDENKGFPTAVNQGIRAATGDIICLLNNDVFVTPGWAEILTGWLDEYSIIGPMTNYAAGVQSTAIGFYDNLDGLSKAAADLTEENQGASTDVNFIIGFCMIFKKSLFDEIGEFDESLWPCSGEEIDFCFRAREAGRRIGIAMDVYMHHEGSKTFDIMESAGQIEYMKIVERNDKHLAEKWGADFWQRQIVHELKNTDGVHLNLGCGRFPLPGFINIDQFEDVKPDLVADVTKLPYEPGTVDEIYCGHMLEHLDWKEGQDALEHWLEILKPGGTISICVPDFDVLAKKHAENPSAAAMRQMNDLYVYSYQQESPHKYMYNGALLKSVMINAGFVEVERMPRNHPYFVDPVEWQVGYSGVKL